MLHLLLSEASSSSSGSFFLFSRYLFWRQ